MHVMLRYEKVQIVEYHQYLTAQNRLRKVKLVMAQCSCGKQLLCSETAAKKILKNLENFIHD